MTFALARPSLALFETWSEAVREYGGVHIDGSGLTAPVSSDRATLVGLIAKAEQLADTNQELPGDLVHNDLYWMTDDDEVVGFLSFRHELNSFLSDVGGHIGYSVRPSRRRRGYASLALDLGLDRARTVGLGRVLITCDDTNVGSARVIEKAGGSLEGIFDQSAHGHPHLRRYWIEL